MIRIKIAELLAKNKMTQKQLSELTNIRAATISKMRYEENKRITIQQIDILCKVLHCQVGDILEYVEEEESYAKNQPLVKTALSESSSDRAVFHYFISVFCYFLYQKK